MIRWTPAGERPLTDAASIFRETFRDPDIIARLDASSCAFDDLIRAADLRMYMEKRRKRVTLNGEEPAGELFSEQS